MTFVGTSIGVGMGAAASAAVPVAPPPPPPAPAFDPTTLGAGVALTRFNDAAMYQDAAGTTLAGIGEPVGYIADLTGNGLHFTQATASKRPLLRADASGNRYLEFDAVDDFIELRGVEAHGIHQLGMAANFDTTSRAMNFMHATQSRYVALVNDNDTGTAINYAVGTTGAFWRVSGAAYLYGVATRDDLYEATRGKNTLVAQFDTPAPYAGFGVGVGTYGASWAFSGKLYGLLATTDVALPGTVLAEIEAWWQEAMQ